MVRASQAYTLRVLGPLKWLIIGNIPLLYFQYYQNYKGEGDLALLGIAIRIAIKI